MQEIAICDHAQYKLVSVPEWRYSQGGHRRQKNGIPRPGE